MSDDYVGTVSPKELLELRKAGRVMNCPHLKGLAQAQHCMVGRDGKTNKIEMIVLSCKECINTTRWTFKNFVPKNGIIEEFMEDEFIVE